MDPVRKRLWTSIAAWPESDAMSDQRIAPDGALGGAPGGAHGGSFGDAPDDAAVVAPVPAHEPPYYAVVFTSTRTADQSGYGKTAERMEELVKDVPGFLGMDQAHTPGGPAITVGYFRDAAAVEEWRANVEHRAAKARGRAEWYESYSLHIAKVERSHSFVRGEAKHDGACIKAGSGQGVRGGFPVAANLWGRGEAAWETPWERSETCWSAGLVSEKSGIYPGVA